MQPSEPTPDQLFDRRCANEGCCGPLVDPEFAGLWDVGQSDARETVAGTGAEAPAPCSWLQSTKESVGQHLRWTDQTGRALD